MFLQSFGAIYLAIFVVAAIQFGRIVRVMQCKADGIPMQFWQHAFVLGISIARAVRAALVPVALGLSGLAQVLLFERTQKDLTSSNDQATLAVFTAIAIVLSFFAFSLLVFHWYEC